MAFYLAKLRLPLAIKAYEDHARFHGLPAARIRASLCRRELSGKWALSDGQRIVAIVTPRKAVQIVAENHQQKVVVSTSVDC